MIQALIIAGLLFFPSPVYRDPSGAQEIALTQWGEAWLGVAHNNKAGAAFYEADTVRVLIGGAWVEYRVVEAGVYLCDTPRPNCNDETFRRMYEPGAVILATCWPRDGMTRGQWIIKMLPNKEHPAIMQGVSVYTNQLGGTTDRAPNRQL